MLLKKGGKLIQSTRRWDDAAGITEEKLRLIGPVAGKRLLEIGCGGGQCSIAFARQGALVTAIDIASAQVEIARELAEQNGVAITLIQHDIIDLSPIPTQSQDVVFSACAFFYVVDLLTCFREVHRVLKADGLFVWSVPHPFTGTIDPQTMLPTRSYFDTGLVVEGLEVSDEPGFAFASVNRTASEYFSPARCTRWSAMRGSTATAVSWRWLWV